MGKLKQHDEVEVVSASDEERARYAARVKALPKLTYIIRTADNRVFYTPKPVPGSMLKSTVQKYLKVLFENGYLSEDEMICQHRLLNAVRAEFDERFTEMRKQAGLREPKVAEELKSERNALLAAARKKNEEARDAKRAARQERKKKKAWYLLPEYRRQLYLKRKAKAAAEKKEP